MDGGMNPQWNDTLELPKVSKNDSLSIICYDEDLVMEEYIGKATFKVKDLIDCKQRTWMPLIYKGKKAAEILIETKFFPASLFQKHLMKHALSP